MRDFTFHSPDSMAEVLALMDLYGEDARVMAGGTALVNLMKQSLVDAAHIISLARVPGLEGVEVEGDALRIGPLTRMRDVETSSTVRDRAPLLADVYSRVGTVRVRNMASVGGGLAHADPAQDPPPALLVLGASVTLSSSTGERTVAMSDFFRDYYETAIRPGELLTAVTAPLSSPLSRTVYFKYLPRSAEDYATVGVAALGETDGDVCTTVRVALAGAGPTPVVSSSVERELTGRSVSAATIRRAAEAVVEDIDPLDDARGSADYKRDMAVVWTRRALERVLLPA